MKNEDLDALANWKPKPSAGLSSDINEYGYPTTIYRTPSKLVEECERAFDCGLLLAALNLVVVIPDVCATIAETDYRTWCKNYLGLPYDGKKMTAERESVKSRKKIDNDLKTVENRGIFTVSDLYQLRCAVVHADSSTIDGKGKNYTPYRAIGVCVIGDADRLIMNWGHTGTESEGKQKDCSFDCVVVLEGLISLIARGVRNFIEEDSTRDREYSSTTAFRRKGVVDFRPLKSKQHC